MSERILKQNGKTSLKQKAKAVWTLQVEGLTYRIIIDSTTQTIEPCNSLVLQGWIRAVQQVFRINFLHHIITSRLPSLTIVTSTLWCREDRPSLHIQMVDTTQILPTITWATVSSIKLKLPHLAFRVTVANQERVEILKWVLSLATSRGKTEISTDMDLV